MLGIRSRCGQLVMAIGTGNMKLPKQAIVPSVLRYASSSSQSSSSSPIVPLHPTLPNQGRIPYREPDVAVDHLVIGAGVVGLSIAAALARRWPEKSTYIVERNERAGEETSSRNSEVIHAGLYYPANSHKTRLCLRGRELLYERCQQYGIAHRQTGKLVVGPESAHGYFSSLQAHAQSLGAPYAPPCRLLSGDEARELEPDLSPEIGFALLSERTGIVSSHELSESLEHEIQEASSAELVYGTSVVRIDPHLPSQAAATVSKRGIDGSNEGWVVQTVTGSTGADDTQNSPPDTLLARAVINSSGLNGNLVLNSLLAEGRNPSDASFAPDSLPLSMWYTKGNYASYKGPGVENVRRLIYPLPEATKGKPSGKHDHHSLGTHLTLDLAGNVRFGPDTQWLSPPLTASSTSPLSHVQAIDFWKSHLVPFANDNGLTGSGTKEDDLDRATESHLRTMHHFITSYLPNVTLDGLAPDYVGIRPKLCGPGSSFTDFSFLLHYSRDLRSQRLWQDAFANSGSNSASSSPIKDTPILTTAEGTHRGGIMLTCAGIESPGLTSCLAIAEMIEELIAQRVWGDKQSSRRTRHGKRVPPGARVEEVGGENLAAWA